MSDDVPLQIIPVIFGRRPDGMTTFPYRRGRSLVWDVTVVDTYAACNILNSTIAASSAANHAERLKDEKYRYLEGRYIFEGLAFETTGAWGKNAERVIVDVAHQLYKATGERRQSSWLRERISLAIVRGNAQSIFITCKELKNFFYDCGHLSMTYTGLCSLLLLGDQFDRVDRRGLLEGIVSLQSKSGLFHSTRQCQDGDMRFVFSGVASCYLLDGLDCINRDAVVGFIQRSMTHEGAFGQLPGLESHAGSTYCALASLVLLDRLDHLLPPQSIERNRLIGWLTALQSRGFHGRPNKDDDTCYTFWIGASLKMLGAGELVNFPPLIDFVSTAIDDVLGGICKLPQGCSPDPLHTYLCLSGLACLTTTSLSSSNTEDVVESLTTNHHDNNNDQAEKRQALHQISLELPDMCPQLNITQKAFDALKVIHQRWRCNQSRL